MIINFSNTLDERRVQEMIDAALSGLSISGGLVNLSTASAGEIISACTDDSTIFSINYSGKTYTEQYRESSGDSLYVYFYVIGAQADEPAYEIYDSVLRAAINTLNGTYTLRNMSGNYIDANFFAPNIYYDVDKMNAEQIDLLSRRLINSQNKNNKRFTASWTYENKAFVYASGVGNGTGPGELFAGINTDGENIYFDFIRGAWSVLQNKHILVHSVEHLNAQFDLS